MSDSSPGRSANRNTANCMRGCRNGWMSRDRSHGGSYTLCYAITRSESCIQEVTPMTVHSQKDRALQFRQMHINPPLLVLPNAWDAAIARIFEQAGFRAIATTSADVAASLGNPTVENISLHMFFDT